MPLKNSNSVVPFYFKDKTHEEVANLMDKEYPVTARYNKDLIDRVYERYPVVEKYKIALVVNALFSSLRYNLIQGRSISFFKMFSKFRFHFFASFRKKILINLSAKMITPYKSRTK